MPFVVAIVSCQREYRHTKGGYRNEETHIGREGLSEGRGSGPALWTEPQETEEASPGRAARLRSDVREADTDPSGGI